MYLITAARLPGQRFFEGQVFHLGNVSFRLFRRDIRALRLVAKIAADPDRGKVITWLLKYRKQFRKLNHLSVGPALSLAAVSTRDRAICLVALFMRSRVTSKSGANELAKLGLINDAFVRRRVALTLSRMGAWAQLRDLVAQSPELEGIAREAKSVERRPFSDRKQQFFANRTLSRASDASICQTGGMPPGSCCPVTVIESNFFRGKPAKPRWLIRLVLDRVRLRVSNKRSVDRLPKQIEYLDLD